MANSPNDSNYSKNMTLLLEFQQLCSANIDGLIVHPSFSDTNDSIDGTLIVHSGYWKGAKIHFTLTLPHSLFGVSIRVCSTKVFHPLVSCNDGSIAQLHTTKSPITTSKLLPLVQTLYRIFTSPLAQVIGCAEKVLNQEAASLFQDDKEAFSKRIKETLEILAEETMPSPYSVTDSSKWTSEHDDILQRLQSEIKSPGNAEMIY